MDYLPDEGDGVGDSSTAAAIPDTSIVTPDPDVAEVDGNAKRSTAKSSQHVAVTSSLVDSWNGLLGKGRDKQGGSQGGQTVRE